MSRTYMIGYSGSNVTEAALLSSPMWQRFDPEFAARVKALMDAAIDDGQAIGPGGGWRSSDQQRTLFLSRFHPEDDTNMNGDTYWPYTLPTPMYGRPAGTLVQYWEPDPGEAPAAPPNRSYHESTTKPGKCLAVDMVGSTKWYIDRCSKFGLVHFGNINGELWHLQPAEIPHARKGYNPALHEPLRPFGAGVHPPAPPAPPAKPFVVVPVPTMQLTSPPTGNLYVAQLQQVLVFWKWMPEKTSSGGSSIDGWFGNMVKAGVIAMQKALGLKQDGIYGPVTAAAYKKFAEAMATFAAAK